MSTDSRVEALAGFLFRSQPLAAGTEPFWHVAAQRAIQWFDLQSSDPMAPPELATLRAENERLTAEVKRPGPNALGQASDIATLHGELSAAREASQWTEADAKAAADTRAGQGADLAKAKQDRATFEASERIARAAMKPMESRSFAAGALPSGTGPDQSAEPCGQAQNGDPAMTRTLFASIPIYRDLQVTILAECPSCHTSLDDGEDIALSLNASIPGEGVFIGNRVSYRETGDPDLENSPIGGVSCKECGHSFVPKTTDITEDLHMQIDRLIAELIQAKAAMPIDAAALRKSAEQAIASNSDMKDMATALIFLELLDERDAGAARERAMKEENERLRNALDVASSALEGANKIVGNFAECYLALDIIEKALEPKRETDPLDDVPEGL